MSRTALDAYIAKKIEIDTMLVRLTTLSDNNTEASARKFVTAWIPVLWGGGGFRAEQVKPEPKPQARPHAQPPRRPVVRRPVCPPGYICEVR